MRGVFIVNAGGWFIYLVPAAICTLAYDRLRSITIRVLNLPDQCLRTMMVTLGHVRYSDALPAHAHGRI